MAQAFLVYGLLLIVLMCFWTEDLLGSNRIKINGSVSASGILLVFFSTVIFAITLGLRYNVGGDYKSYVDYYHETTSDIAYADVPFEIGFYYLILVLKALGLPYWSLFLVMCAIQMIFLGAWLTRQSDAAPWLIFFYFTTLLGFESLNIIRQATSLMIVLFALSCLSRGALWRFCAWILLASTFHVSALMFLPLAFFLGREWRNNRIILFVLLVVSYLAANELQEILFDVLPLLSLLSSGYANLQTELFFEADASILSFGLLLAFLVDALVIYFYSELVGRYRSNGFVLYFNIFYIGALISPVVYFSNYIAFTRLAFYFTSFRFVMLGFLLAYLMSKDARFGLAKVLATTLILAYLGMFCVAIFRGAAWCSPYQFVFE